MEVKTFASLHVQKKRINRKTFSIFNFSFITSTRATYLEQKFINTFRLFRPLARTSTNFHNSNKLSNLAFKASNFPKPAAVPVREPGAKLNLPERNLNGSPESSITL